MFGYSWDSSPEHDQRMRRFVDAGIYLVTSGSLSAGRSTATVVSAALDGGIRLVQAREKDIPAGELVAICAELRKITHRASALLIVNDRLDVALSVGADGVHLGQDDLPVAEARRIAPDLVIGASSHSVDEAAAAQEQGASYVNIGPLFPTRTKKWSGEYLGLDGLRSISQHLAIPFTVMGGIRREHICDLAAAGARTVALVTAITTADDPRLAAEELLAELAAAQGESGAAPAADE